MSMYDKVVASIQPTQLELNLQAGVKAFITEVSTLSPSDRAIGLRCFEELNVDSVSLITAPTNKLLIVVSDSLSVLMRKDKHLNVSAGRAISRGSVLIKLKTGLVYCLDAYSWFGSPKTGRLISSNGYFTYNSIRQNGLVVHGLIKELSKIKL